MSREKAVWVVLLALSLGGVCRAQDAPPAPAGPLDEKALLERLKPRITAWATTRAALLTTCGVCTGTGSTSYLAGGRVVARTCSKCAGAGRTYSVAAGRKLLFDMRSPSFRTRPTAKDEAGAEFKTWTLENAKLICPSRWRLDRVDLVTPRHALVWTYDGDATASTPTHWVFDAGIWWLWTEVADGKWPATHEEATAVAAESIEPLPQLQAIAVESALDKAALTAKPGGRGHRGRLLVVTLAYGESDRGVLSLSGGDSIAATRALFRAMPDDWDAIRLEFTGIWQDRFGERSTARFAAVTITAETFKKIRWENLTLDQAWALYSYAEDQRQGLTLVNR
jgi:hypothetical protein